MTTYDVSAGHIADYTGEAYCGACFLEAFALAVAEKQACSIFPDADAWTGFFYVTQDFTRFLRALNERAGKQT